MDMVYVNFNQDFIEESRFFSYYSIIIYVLLYDFIFFFVCIDLVELSELSFVCEFVLCYEVLLLLILRFVVCCNCVENVMMQEQFDFGSIYGVVKEL